MLLQNIFAIRHGIQASNQRQFWAWLNIMFNLVDKKRIKDVGPDRACAEWIIRNGGQVTFHGEEPTKDYNFLARLPAGLTKQLIEVDASEASITHQGFSHFKGCNYLESLKFHKNSYLTDGAVADLKCLTASLKKLHISSCDQITDKGVLSISQISKLSDLTLRDLGVKDWKNCESHLKEKLPNCNLDLPGVK